MKRLIRCPKEKNGSITDMTSVTSNHPDTVDTIDTIDTESVPNRFDCLHHICPRNLVRVVIKFTPESVFVQ